MWNVNGEEHAQADQFAPPHAGVQRQRPERLVCIGLGRIQEAQRLRIVPVPTLRPGDARRGHTVYRVAGQQV